jgi:hypothetical protein
MKSLYEKDAVSEKKETAYGNFVIEQIKYERKEFSLLRFLFIINHEKACGNLHVTRRTLIEQCQQATVDTVALREGVLYHLCIIVLHQKFLT